MKKLYKLVLTLILITVLPAPALSGDWRVTPIRVFFDRNQKSDIINVFNEGDEDISLQIKAMQWAQDAEGTESYTDTKDLIFFPRILTLKKDEKRLIRIGIKVPATKTEKTYRLFIEEMPQTARDGTKGVKVALAIRFGVPVFVSPLREKTAGSIERLDLTDGTLNLLIKNTGNVHFIVNRIIAKGADTVGNETFSKELAGWYVLTGSSKAFTFEIPSEECLRTDKIDLEVTTDKFKLDKKLDVNKAMCGD